MLIDSKVKHCNSTVDSLHVKTNVLDNQLKEIIGSQNQHTSLLETNQSQITNLKDRVEYIETTNSSWLAHIDNPQQGLWDFFFKYAFQGSILEFIRSTCIF